MTQMEFIPLKTADGRLYGHARIRDGFVRFSLREPPRGRALILTGSGSITGDCAAGIPVSANVEAVALESDGKLVCCGLARASKLTIDEVRRRALALSSDTAIRGQPPAARTPRAGSAAPAAASGNKPMRAGVDDESHAIPMRGEQPSMRGEQPSVRGEQPSVRGEQPLLPPEPDKPPFNSSTGGEQSRAGSAAGEGGHNVPLRCAIRRIPKKNVLRGPETASDAQNDELRHPSALSNRAAAPEAEKEKHSAVERTRENELRHQTALQDRAAAPEVPQEKLSAAERTRENELRHQSALSDRAAAPEVPQEKLSAAERTRENELRHQTALQDRAAAPEVPQEKLSAAERTRENELRHQTALHDRAAAPASAAQEKKGDKAIKHAGASAASDPYEPFRAPQPRSALLNAEYAAPLAAEPAQLSPQEPDTAAFRALLKRSDAFFRSIYEPAAPSAAPASVPFTVNTSASWHSEADALIGSYDSERKENVRRVTVPNPFPHIFPNASFVKLVDNGLTGKLEGSWQRGCERFTIHAVPGSYSPLPPPELCGYTRYIRSRAGGFWVKVTDA